MPDCWLIINQQVRCRFGANRHRKGEEVKLLASPQSTADMSIQRQEKHTGNKPIKLFAKIQLGCRRPSSLDQWVPCPATVRSSRTDYAFKDCATACVCGSELGQWKTAFSLQFVDRFFISISEQCQRNLVLEMVHLVIITPGRFSPVVFQFESPKSGLEETQFLENL